MLPSNGTFINKHIGIESRLEPIYCSAYDPLKWRYLVKADMNGYILLQTAAIFFSIEPISKTGY